MVIKKFIRCIVFCLAMLLSLSIKVWAFPALTGQVVDEAHILSPQTERQLTTLLQSETKHQVVVVTLANLEGKTIDDYGYQLGRHWGIGEKGNDNGVLLIIAPNEKQVRIEVGYGLEGALTDAVSNRAALIGTEQILTVIHNETFKAHPSEEIPTPIAIILTGLVLWLFIYVAMAPKNDRARRLRLILTLISFVPGKGMHGFKGKGGRFGGGGASKKF